MRSLIKLKLDIIKLTLVEIVLGTLVEIVLGTLFIIEP